MLLFFILLLFASNVFDCISSLRDFGLVMLKQLHGYSALLKAPPSSVGILVLVFHWSNPQNLLQLYQIRSAQICFSELCTPFRAFFGQRIPVDRLQCSPCLLYKQTASIGLHSKEQVFAQERLFPEASTTMNWLLQYISENG